VDSGSVRRPRPHPDRLSHRLQAEVGQGSEALLADGLRRQKRDDAVDDPRPWMNPSALQIFLQPFGFEHGSCFGQRDEDDFGLGTILQMHQRCAE
jgi:hypothetical protein